MKEWKVRDLAADPASTFQTSIGDRLRDAGPHSEVVSDPLSPDVLDQGAGGDLDGVPCRAAGPETIPGVLRIRRQNSDVPIAVLNPTGDSEDVGKACGHLANSFPVQSVPFDHLVMRVRSIAVFGTRINLGRTA
ncbi:MAG TPA: hypothetical protein VG457_19180 [Planctomycetota bacterium]|jgi:hypothetical protein|nr:hypothetical protein [Planctomycetota bacterium]